MALNLNYLRTCFFLNGISADESPLLGCLPFPRINYPLWSFWLLLLITGRKMRQRRQFRTKTVLGLCLLKHKVRCG